LVGIGILWKQGYGRQVVNGGAPTLEFEDHDYDFLEDTGAEVTVQVRGEDVRCKVWKVDAFGNAPLYLLDTDLPGNPEPNITDRLYGGGGEERVAQEIVLGVGGVRALRALGIDVDVYHFNEGHALPAAFELVREKREAGQSQEEALAATREEVVFTTHTPVPAGNEVHPVDRLVEVGADLGLGRDALVGLGGEHFNMTAAALRLSRKANAVAQLHGVTANGMWDDVDGRAEIVAITNGIHRPTWVDDAVLERVDDPEALWAAHQENKRALIGLVRERAGVEFAEDRLLIGFARRAVTYKRANLIFSDLDRIGPLLRERKLQLVFSGKAHLLDEYGRAIVADLVAKSKEFPGAVAFVPDYDMVVGAAMTRGADVWLNNPRRPMEASGTSGMKAAMNGVLNCSVLDGWWPEAAEHGVNGWQFGDAFESPDEAAQDAHDLAALYRVLFDEVIPTYYDDRDRWVEMMQASIRSTRDRFSVARMLNEYEERLYQN
ncbi:MAG: alpha-glucan family phosphorylase, partial [Rhodothermales bacterium]|nr:alpha-glucan family phosphorylase [Rhodothermales bacterium]